MSSLLDKSIYFIGGGELTVYYYIQNESMYDIVHEIHYTIDMGGNTE